MTLPIENSIPSLRRALSGGVRVVLRAPPGTGKTTLAPPALLDEPWLAGRKILMLEPRRLATRSAARRIAKNLQTEVGGLVGYRTRTDTAVVPSTRLEVLTEGILTRMLQRDPGLEDVGLVIFDEFHERSVHADLGLALALDIQTNLRPDLRLLIMSATIDESGISNFLGGAEIVSCEGQVYPVSVTHVRRSPEERLEPLAVRLLRHVAVEEKGDILVFLPGAREILGLERTLRSCPEFDGVTIAPLYGDLDKNAQDAAILPSPDGHRKVVLATSIAESSITIEGVRIVVDSGLTRKPRFNPRTGLERLETVRVSKASAEQRKGRAGRLCPGICIRLWSEEEHRSLAENDLPEIIETDLAPLALELAKWGVSDPASLKWLDPPPKTKFEQGRDVLRALDALDDSGKITSKGSAMLELGTHPRLASMLLESKRLGWADLACELAALLDERDILRQDSHERNSDIRLRVELLRHGSAHDGSWDERRVDKDLRRRLLDSSGRLRRKLGGTPAQSKTPVDKSGLLLAYAFPDRIAARRVGAERSYVMANGRGARFFNPEPIATEESLVIAEVDDKDRDAKVFMAAPVPMADMEKHFPGHFKTEQILEWDDRTGAVAAVKRRTFGEIILSESSLPRPDPAKCVGILLDVIRRKGLSSLPWSAESENLRARIEFIGKHDAGGGWPDFSDAGLLKTVDDWLGPFLNGVRRLEDLGKIRLSEALTSVLDHRQKEALRRLAPDRFALPTGSTTRIDYAGGTPSLSARVQELFGTRTHPCVLGGKIPVVVKLLSPAMRPVQSTTNLPGFWASSYSLVKKDLKGRYPKHPWPDDPMSAAPTRRIKKK